MGYSKPGNEVFSTNFLFKKHLNPSIHKSSVSPFLYNVKTVAAPSLTSHHYSAAPQSRPSGPAAAASCPAPAPSTGLIILQLTPVSWRLVIRGRFRYQTRQPNRPLSVAVYDKGQDTSKVSKRSFILVIMADFVTNFRRSKAISYL